MRFSERIGKKKTKIDIQVDSMDDALRNSLWSIIYLHIFEPVHNHFIDDLLDHWLVFFRLVWLNFFKSPIDGVPIGAKRLIEYMKYRWFNESDWLERYDFIEFIAQTDGPYNNDLFIDNCNEMLERELSAYRFVGDILTPITDETEIKEIKEAIETAHDHKLKGVRLHLSSALGKISDRKNPDYRNSIKESISAVESLAKQISGKKTATLGEIVKELEKDGILHKALKNAFSSLYGYTSDAKGIRHALLDKSKLTKSDAQFMLVCCSAFINYVIDITK